MILKVIFESNCSLEGFLEILGSEERPKTCSQTCFKTLEFPLEMAPHLDMFYQHCFWKEK